MADEVKQDAGGHKVKNSARVDDAAERWPSCPKCGNQPANSRYLSDQEGKPGGPKVNIWCECGACTHRWQIGTEQRGE